MKFILFFFVLVRSDEEEPELTKQYIIDLIKVNEQVQAQKGENANFEEGDFKLKKGEIVITESHGVITTNFRLGIPGTELKEHSHIILENYLLKKQNLEKYLTIYLRDYNNFVDNQLEVVSEKIDEIAKKLEVAFKLKIDVTKPEDFQADSEIILQIEFNEYTEKQLKETINIKQLKDDKRSYIQIQNKNGKIKDEIETNYKDLFIYNFSEKIFLFINDLYHSKIQQLEYRSEILTCADLQKDLVKLNVGGGEKKQIPYPYKRADVEFISENDQIVSVVVEGATIDYKCDTVPKEFNDEDGTTEPVNYLQIKIGSEVYNLLEHSFFYTQAMFDKYLVIAAVRYKELQTKSDAVLDIYESFGAAEVAVQDEAPDRKLKFLTF